MTNDNNIHIRMNRPEWNKIASIKGMYISCSCGQILTSIESIREHWQNGHFDYSDDKD